MSTITVFGYGSLLSQKWAEEMVESCLSNFRLVRVKGYRRIFNKVGIVFFRRYNIPQDDLKVSSCATRYDGETEIICSAFECSGKDFLKIYEREHRFRWILVDGVDSEGRTHQGRMCTEYTDEDYLLNKCILEEEYHSRVKQYYQGKIWRNDIFPHTLYLRHCLKAAKQHSGDVYNNFISTSYLSDGSTPISEYLVENPWILDEMGDDYSYQKAES
ncbi:MAG: hypothetical protein MJA27_13265 [Pseudanabaenales cyanobacterium]|nr:hypothetical protein [Pseudanabaenales cyanobacterium]